MSVSARIAGYVLLLAVVLVAGFGVGRLVGPFDGPAQAPPEAPADHTGGDHAVGPR